LVDRAGDLSIESYRMRVRGLGGLIAVLTRRPCPVGLVEEQDRSEDVRLERRLRAAVPRGAAREAIHAENRRAQLFN